MGSRVCRSSAGIYFVFIATKQENCCTSSSRQRCLSNQFASRRVHRLIYIVLNNHLLTLKKYSMKKLNLQPYIMLVLMAALSLSLFSFTAKINRTVFGNDATAGGEGFEIYLDNKLVLQQFGKEMNTVKTVYLDQRTGNGELAIRYFHCGRAGKNRVVMIKDEQRNVLKEWRFDNVNDASTKMCCNVKEILALPKLKAGKKLNLYYASTEIPGGRLLAILAPEKENSVLP